jgi:hypothetical protein
LPDFRAVNESVWEHLKLAFWPMLVWWLVGYLLLGRKKSGSPARFAVTCAISEVVCLWFIVAFFYTYTGAFGIESLALDILSLFLGLVAAVLVVRHVIIHTKPGGAASFLAVVVLLVLAAAFAYFTFAPRTCRCFRIPRRGLRYRRIKIIRLMNQPDSGCRQSPEALSTRSSSGFL